MQGVVVLCGLGGAGVLAVLFLFDPANHALYPACTFRRWTGLNCPGCGGLRATHQMLHGHLVTALRFNALAVVLWPALAIWGLWRWHRRRRPVPPRLKPTHTLWLWLMLGALATFSIARNLPFAPFCWLSPP